MPLPTGTISLSDVNIELGRAATASINLNESPVRALAGISSGTISMNDLRGKSASRVMSVLIIGGGGGGGTGAAGTNSPAGGGGAGLGGAIYIAGGGELNISGSSLLFSSNSAEG